MFLKIVVDPRIMEKHGDVICQRDILHAFKNLMYFKERENGSFIGVGGDKRNRLIGLAFYIDSDSAFIFHALPDDMTILKQFGIKKKRS